MPSRASRKQVGGALNRVPRPSVDLQNEGSRVNNAADLQKYMTFYSVIGHGSIPPRDKGTLFLVPERTYIMFVARAGEPTDKIKPATDAILDAFRYKRRDPSKPSGVEDDAAWYQRTYDSMENGSLFRDLLYNLALPDNSKRISVYQPGDLVQNLDIDIENTSPPWDPVGIWTLPMEPETAQDLETARAEFITHQDGLYAGEAKPIIDKMNKFITEKADSLTAIALKAQDEGDTITVSMAIQAAQTIRDIGRYLLYSYKMPNKDLKSLDARLRPEGGIDSVTAFLEDPSNGLLSELKKQLDAKIAKLAKDNMIVQSAFDRKPKNKMEFLLGSTRFFNDPHNPGSRSRSTTIFKLIENEPTIGFTNYTQRESFKIYRFFIFDICRSLQGTPYPVAKRLVRSLSNVMRFDDAPALPLTVAAAAALGAGAGGPAIASPVSPQFQSILKLTRQEIQNFLSLAATQKVPENPILRKLLEGNLITYMEFEQLFGTNADLWEGAFEEFVKYHRFDKGQRGLVIFDERARPTIPALLALDRKNVIVDSFVIREPKIREATYNASSGIQKPRLVGPSFFYQVKETDTSQVIPIPVTALWKSEADHNQAVRQRESIPAEKARYNVAYSAAEVKQENTSKEQERLNAVLTSPEVIVRLMSGALPTFRIRDNVTIRGMSGLGPANLNGLSGIIRGASIDMRAAAAGGSRLLYKVLITSPGAYYNTLQDIDATYLQASASGGKRKSKTSKRRKHNKRTRRASK